MAKTVQVAKNLPQKEGIQKVIKKTLREQGGDDRGATYNPKTGRGKAI